MSNDLTKHVGTVHWLLLGLTMLVPGLLKLFVMKPGAVSGMLTEMGFPAPVVLAWILILAEILAGIAILAKWNLDSVKWVPAIILVVAAVTVHWGSWPSVLIHLTVAADFLLLGSKS